MIFSNDCYIENKCLKHAKDECEPDSFCIKLFKYDKLCDEAMLSKKQRQYLALRIDGDGTDREEFSKLKELEKWSERFVQDGRNLYLFSTGCGNGKTSWALRIIQSYFHQIWFKSDISCRALFVSVPKFFLMLKASLSKENDYINHIKSNVDNCDLVVWDDIGTKVGTEFEIENLLNIISNRLDSGKANIYTSNMTPDQLRERVGERLYSRIINMSDTIELHGADKRGI